MRAVRARLTQSPSTVPIRTRELVIADRRALRRYDGDDAAPERQAAAAALWREQRKDPGCVVGEHMHVFRPPAAEGRFPAIGLAATDRCRPGEVGRLSKENRTEWDGGGEEPARLTRVGEADRWWKKEEEREVEEEKAEAAEEAKAEPVEERQPPTPDDDDSRPDGEIERRNALESGSTAPLDLVLEEEAIRSFSFLGGKGREKEREGGEGRRVRDPEVVFRPLIGQTLLASGVVFITDLGRGEAGHDSKQAVMVVGRVIFRFGFG